MFVPFPFQVSPAKELAMTHPEAVSIKDIAHFRFLIPAGYCLQDVSPKMMDFYVLRLSKYSDDKSFLTIYIGGHPKIPMLKWNSEPSHRSLPDRQMLIFGGKHQKQAIETLVEFQDLTYKAQDSSPWDTIHFFGSDLSVTDFSAFSSFVDSVEVVKKHID